jgi:hypothetical protein
MSETTDADRVLLTDEEAIAMLPDGDTVHTFRQSAAGVLIGADWPRERLIAAIREGQPELSGGAATGMGHGLAVGLVGTLFVETRKPEGAR